GAFGDPGHAFPVIALGRELVQRGHEVTLETWERWRGAAEAEGMALAAAPEYHVFPTRERPLKPYQGVVRAAGGSRGPGRRWGPGEHVVGPLFWAQPSGDVAPPPGDAPLVLVAPSTSQDPGQRLLLAALDGLAGEDVRMLASTNNRPPAGSFAVPANARLVD